MNFRKPITGILGTGALVVWIGGVLAFLACSGAWHYAALSGPPVGSLPIAVASQTHWSMTHVLAADCGCSAAVVRHLERRKRLPDVPETVWLVGTNPGWVDRLVAGGFAVETKPELWLETTAGITAAPLLLIANASGLPVYSGGYSRQNPAARTVIEDVALLTAARAGHQLEPLPTFGCATAGSLKSRLDPLGIKQLLNRSSESP
jgi:hypothetical protein